MSDRIIIFKDGKIEQEGTPKSIYHHPNSLFVADFIGDSNIFNGTVIKKTLVYTMIRLVDDDYVRVKSNDPELYTKYINKVND